MKSKRIFVLSISLLSVIIVIQSIILIKPFNRKAVRTPDTAILLAKAALVRRYGEAEFKEMEFDAVVFGTKPNYWYICEYDPNVYGYAPHVLVRMSDGKVRMRWTTNSLWNIVDSWFYR